MGEQPRDTTHLCDYHIVQSHLEVVGSNQHNLGMVVVVWLPTLVVLQNSLLVVVVPFASSHYYSHHLESGVSLLPLSLLITFCF